MRGNDTAQSLITTSMATYIFHILPGLPALYAFCRILKPEWVNQVGALCLQQIVTNTVESISLLVFGLVVLLLLSFVLGLIIDACRHVLEEFFLVPKRHEFSIVEEMVRKSKKDITSQTIRYNWLVVTQMREAEYFYCECWGNLSLSFALLWGALAYRNCAGSSSPFLAFYVWAHLIFLARPAFARSIWKWQDDWRQPDKDQYKLTKAVLFRAGDFSATIFTLVLSYIAGLVSYELFAYWPFFAAVFITAPFEYYLIRFRRYQKLLRYAFPAAYDGKATGEGWFNPEPSNNGGLDLDNGSKATFKFWVDQGAGNPSGHLEFGHGPSKLNLKSKNYEWASVASTEIQFGGVGVIDPEGEKIDCRFRVKAIVGSEAGVAAKDRFEISIVKGMKESRSTPDYRAEGDLCRGQIVIRMK
jgi:hypothetical protein